MPGSCKCAEAAGDLLPHLDHTQISLSLIVIKIYTKVFQEAAVRPDGVCAADQADYGQRFVCIVLVSQEVRSDEDEVGPLHQVGAGSWPPNQRLPVEQARFCPAHEPAR